MWVVAALTRCSSAQTVVAKPMWMEKQKKTWETIGIPVKPPAPKGDQPPVQLASPRAKTEDGQLAPIREGSSAEMRPDAPAGGEGDAAGGGAAEVAADADAGGLGRSLGRAGGLHESVNRHAAPPAAPGSRTQCLAAAAMP